MLEEGREDFRNGRFFADEDVEQMVNDWESKGK